jgi:uncharacterized Zn-finger protein
MAVQYHDLADLITNTFCALLGIQTVRPAFYKQFAASKDKSQNHQCENTLLLLLKLLKAENQGNPRHTLENLSAKLKEYIEIEKQSGLVLNEEHAEFSVVRQVHLWTSLKHEPEATRKAKLSPVGPVTREGVKYEETYLIQRLRPQKCTQCGKVCTSLGRLNSHMQRHAAERAHECQECSGSFLTPWELDQHMMVHTDDRPHQCEVPKCDGAFKTVKELVAHAASHKNFPVSCRDSICKRRFKTEADLETHVYLHDLVICSDCREGFEDEESLAAHERRGHEILNQDSKEPEVVRKGSRKRVWICSDPQCFMDFSRKSLLTEHSKIHDDVTFACSDCTKTFKRATALEKHRVTHDPDRPSYACQIPGCLKKYSSPRNLKRHVEDKHATLT